MRNGLHNRKFVGLGALLGLWLVGCQAGPTLSRSKAAPGRPGTAVAQQQQRPLLQAVQLLRPRGNYEPSGSVRTAAAVSIQTPVVRASAYDSSGGVIVASSWRPLQRGPDSYYSSPVAQVPERLSMPLRSGPPQTFTSAPPDQKPQRLDMPRPVEENTPPAAASADPNGPVVYGPGPGPGPGHGAGIPREGNKAALPPYRIEPPDILLIQLYRTGTGVPQDIDGSHLVRPDGTVNLGTYGSVRLGGLTLDEARAAVVSLLRTRITNVQLRDVNVDVIAYNSKVYYVITDGAGYGQQVYRLPITGSETVLDAVGQIGGLPPVSSQKKIWVARANLGHPHAHEILPVNWVAVSQCGSTATNYQLAPGDRVFVQSNPLIRFDSRLGQFLSPIQRSLGVTLLGAATVNSIKGTGAFGGGLGGLSGVR